MSEVRFEHATKLYAGKTSGLLGTENGFDHFCIHEVNAQTTWIDAYGKGE